MKKVKTEKILKLIKDYRNDLGLSQSEMAKRSGISTSFYGMIERGNRSLTVEYLIQIAEALECSAADILEIAENEK